MVVFRSDWKINMNKKWPLCLGDTVEEIRMSLFKQGVKGIPNSVKNHVISRSYKSHYVNGWGELYCRASRSVSSDGSVLFHGSMTFNDFQTSDPICYSALAEFMYRFNCREFPELIIGEIPDKISVLNKLTTEERMALGV